MHINKTWFSFRRDYVPNWRCPSCGDACLNLSPEELRVYESAETSRNKQEDWFDSDYVTYRFSATLHCADIRCNEVVVVIGAGHIDFEYTQTEEDLHKKTYTDCFVPQLFEPCLVPITIPANTPANVRDALNAVFSIIFINRDAAANRLRFSIEVLLDEIRIPSRDKHGNFLKLGVRINDHLNDELRKYKINLSAIQWIGNDGSHGCDDTSIEDLLSGLEIMEFLLHAFFSPPSIDINTLSSKLIEKKKPKKGLQNLGDGPRV